jgi:hypothetical protein
MGPKAKRDIERPLLSGSIISAIVPLPRASGPEPLAPARKHIAMSMLRLVELAHASMKSTKRKLHNV